MFNALEMKYLLSKTSWSTSLFGKTIQKIEITWTFRGLCLKGIKTLNKRESLDLQTSWPSEIPPSQLPLPETKPY